MNSLNTDLAYAVLDGGEQSIELLDTIGSEYVAPILVALFAIAVGFVAYRLIKRALNKA